MTSSPFKEVGGGGGGGWVTRKQYNYNSGTATIVDGTAIILGGTTTMENGLATIVGVLDIVICGKATLVGCLAGGTATI